MAPIKIIFFGTPEISRVCLDALLKDPQYQIVCVVTQPDREAGRGKSLRASPVKELASTNNIPVLQPVSIRKELENFLTQLPAADLGVVVAFGQILPQKLLDYPSHGCINVHGSLLPRWRGAAPIQRSIIAGDKETGVQLMRMEAGLDTGAVYSTAKTPISPCDTFLSLHDRLAVLGAELLTQDLKRIVSGELFSIPQQEQGLTYAEKIKKEEGLINWTKSAEEIHRLIHGLSPSPGAYTFINGKRLKLLKVESRTEDSQATHTPRAAGTITTLESNGVIEVACGSGTLKLLELQLEGKKAMPAKEFLQGSILQKGSILG